MPARRLLAPIAALLACAACAPNGRPLPVAGEVAALEPDVRAELIEQAPPVSAASRPARGADAPAGAGAADGAAASGGVVAGDDADTAPASMPTSAAVIGDSIALSAQQMVTATLESLDIDIVAYDAVESRRMVAGGASLPSGASAIDDVLSAGRLPELWIVALGTNDVGASAGADTMRDDIERILSMIPADADLIWVDTWIRGRGEGSDLVNDLLRQALAGREATWVLDWRSRAMIDGVLIADGVHLSDVGKVEYARMIGDALRSTYERR